MRWFRRQPAGYYLISMMFVFQIEATPGDWLNVGSAEGDGVHGVGVAIHELMKANGGTLGPASTDVARLMASPRNGPTSPSAPPGIQAPNPDLEAAAAIPTPS